jgi:hypothetical protein
MTKADWDLIRAISMETASTLQDGRHSTSEEWDDIADELQRIIVVARKEANALREKE